MIPLSFAALLFLSPPDPSAAKAATRVDPSAEADVQDVIFLSDHRPFLLRLRLRLDNKAFVERWEAHFQRLFAWYDRDGNGFLDKEEAEQAPHPNTLADWLVGGLNGQPGNLVVSFADMDTDKDGKVSPAEFRGYYRRRGAGPIRLNPAFTNTAAAEQITERLFIHLGGHKDAKLTRQLLDKAADVLLRFDQNEDEMITAAELFPGNYAAGFQTFQVANSSLARQGINSSVILVEKETQPGDLAQRYKAAKTVLAHYDKDKNGKLSREEVGFDSALFDRLDENKDGQLDAAELLRWLIVLPDVDAVLRFGTTDPKASGLELAKTKNPTGAGVRATEGRTASLDFHEGRLDLLRGNGRPVAFANIAPTFINTFRNLDKDKKGFITLKQIEEQRQAFFRMAMHSADRDGDGKLTEKELTSWLEMMSGAEGCIFTVTFAENGRGLFEILDANADGRLSIREMRNAWKRLAGYDRDKDGAISRNEIPRQFQMTISQGFPNPGGPYALSPVAFTGRGMMPATAMPPARGPLWFRKMDTNGDGDVSRREFLGSDEEFRRIDTDGDGLISVEEAERADAALREAAKK